MIRFYDYKYRIISLDGDIIHVGGSLTGGSIKTNKSVISEKKELDLLEKKLEELKSVILEINDKFKNIDLTRTEKEQK